MSEWDREMRRQRVSWGACGDVVEVCGMVCSGMVREEDGWPTQAGPGAHLQHVCRVCGVVVGCPLGVAGLNAPQPARQPQRMQPKRADQAGLLEQEVAQGGQGVAVGCLPGGVEGVHVCVCMCVCVCVCARAREHAPVGPEVAEPWSCGVVVRKEPLSSTAA